jgi:hypothetical protein
MAGTHIQIGIGKQIGKMGSKTGPEFRQNSAGFPNQGSKHYAIKTIWFCEKIIEKKIKSPPSRRVFNWETSLPRCLLRSLLNSSQDQFILLAN